MSDKCQCLFWLSFISTLYICFRNIKTETNGMTNAIYQGILYRGITLKLIY